MPAVRSRLATTTPQEARCDNWRRRGSRRTRLPKISKLMENHTISASAAGMRHSLCDAERRRDLVSRFGTSQASQMDIRRISSPGHGHSTPALRGDPSAAQRPQTSELVPVARSQHQGSLHRPTRPSSTFLAQLIATAQHAPQTRSRGSTEPADAIATYISGRNISSPPQSKEWLV